MEQTILIHGRIGSEVKASDIKSQFDKAIESNVDIITLDIETFGGDVYEGKAILGFMDKAKTLGITIRTEVFSYAYSMGAAIFQGATKGQRFIGEFADLMNHQAISEVNGNADDMRMAAEVLDDITKNLAFVILRNDKAKENESEIMAALKTEKFINAEDAIRLGLADGFIEKSKAVAHYNKNKFTNMNFKAILEKLTSIESKFKNEAPAGAPAIVNESVETKEGSKIYFSGTMEVGTAVFSDEAMATPLADGVYTTDMNVIEVASGLVTVITDVQADNSAETIAALQAEVEALKAEKETLAAAKLAAENKVTTIESEINEVRNMVVTMSKPDRNDKQDDKDLPKWKVDMINRKKYELS